MSYQLTIQRKKPLKVVFLEVWPNDNWNALCRVELGNDIPGRLSSVIRVIADNWTWSRLRQVGRSLKTSANVSSLGGPSLLIQTSFNLYGILITGSSSHHLGTLMPKSSSRPLPAKQPNHATLSLFDSKSKCPNWIWTLHMRDTRAVLLKVQEEIQ